ncbi:ribosome biogenesis protein SLX9-domain-containing protein [Lipomyces tetrasporus]|uniref:Ribosome biogenesis protein SLX9 n=1 Tax=Lipomyces tetrasporus TaxID=54092 RepID=A0AAD7QSC6_9ASCO|nr:ribosome biogenesis protein SLX9-domain-containing protein [Lipomyces tetrasporus]KAJ8100529.1 ribosome biogenesis protein SLX9-domain-containing protein [Lipomyces tetrasporus]
MAPRRKSASAVVEARQALRAHSNALKLAAAEATIASSTLHTSKSRSLGPRTGGGITKSTKKTKAVAKRAGLLKRLNGTTSTEDDATAREFSKKRKGLMVPASTSAVTRLSSTAEGPKSRSLDDVKNVSKSARRRIVRAKKEKLAGNGLNDLLDALPSDPDRENSAANDSMNIDVGTSAQKSQDPRLSERRDKPVSQRAHEKILRQEIDRFGKVIAVKDFRENPFAALRGFIQQRI